ncbi:MAG: hypothetical protein J6Y92_07850 [Lentisphaeria bacterium]|nr:hypothetical protein [Lentisphaeria bacterium]
MADIFVNPSWNSGADPITVYVSGNNVSKTNPGDGTSASCYKTLEAAFSAASDGDTIYVYNKSSSSFALIPANTSQADTGVYKLSSGETYSYTGDSRKNLVVRMNRYEVEADKNYAILVSGNITMDFRVYNSIKLGRGKDGQHTSLTVENGAVFLLRKISPYTAQWNSITTIDQFVVNGATACFVGSQVKNEGDNKNTCDATFTVTNSLFFASGFFNNYSHNSGDKADALTVSGSNMTVGYLANAANGTSITIGSASTVYSGQVINTGEKSLISVSGNSKMFAGKVENQGTTAGKGISVTSGSEFTVAAETWDNTGEGSGSGYVLDMVGLQAGAARTIQVYVLKNGDSESNKKTYELTLAADQTTAKLRASYLVTGATYSVWTSEDSDRVSYLSRVFGDGSVSNAGRITVDSSTFNAGSLTNSSSVSVASFTDSTVQVSGTVSNSGKTANSGGMTIEDSMFEAGTWADVVFTGSSVSNSGTITVTATAADKLASFRAGAVTNSGTLTVSSTEDSTSVSTFNATSLTNSSTVSVASFTNSTVQVSGTVSNSGKTANSGGMTIEDSMFEVGTWADDVFTGSAVSNSGTLSVSGSELRAGAMTNSGSMTVDNSTFNEVSLNNSSSVSYAAFTDSVVSFSGSVSNSGKAANNGGMTIEDTLFEAGTWSDVVFTGSSVSNSGTLTVSDSVLRAGAVTNSGSMTVDGSMFNAASFNNSVAASSAALTDSTVQISGTLSNSGALNLTDVSAVVGEPGNNAQCFTNAASSTFRLTSTSAHDSTLAVNGALKNNGTLTISSSPLTIAVASGAARTVSILIKDSSNNTVYSNNAFSVAANVDSISISSSYFTPGATYSVSIDGGDPVLYTMASTTASLSVTGKVTNSNTSSTRAVITVDAWSTFSADSFTNSNGRFNIVYNPDNAGALSINSFDNASGIISIDVTKYLANRETDPVVTVDGIRISASNKLGTVRLVDSSGSTVNGLTYYLNSDNQIVIAPTTLFVNAKWTDDDSTLSKPYTITLTTPDPDDSSKTVSVKYERYKAGDITAGDPPYYAWKYGSDIVYTTEEPENGTYDTTGTIPAVYEKVDSSFVVIDNVSKMVVVLDTSASFNGRSYKLERGVNAFANVQEAIEHAMPGATIVFYNIGDTKDVEDFKFYKQGLVTVDKNLIFESNVKDKAVKLDTLKIDEACEATFKTGLYSMEDALDNAGTLDIVSGTRFNADLVKNSGKGVILVGTAARLVAASIDSGTVEIRTGYEDVDLNWLEWPMSAKIGDNTTLKFVYPVTEYSPAEQEGVAYEYRLIDGIRKLAVVETVRPGGRIYMQKLGDDQYVCRGSMEHASVAAGDCDSFLLNTEYGGLLLVRDVFNLSDADLNGTYSTAAIYVNNTWAGNLPSDTFTAKSQDITSKLTFSFTSANHSARMVKALIYDNNNNIVEEHFVSVGDSDTGEYAGVVALCTNLSADKTYTVKVIDGDAAPISATGVGVTAIANHEVSISTDYDGNQIVYGSFLDAMSSAYIFGHTIGTADEGMVIRLQDSSADQSGTTYIEGVFKGGSYTGPESNVSTSAIPKIPNGKSFYNLVVEPDRYWDETAGQWRYDNVSLILGGSFGQQYTSNLITFQRLKYLEINQFVIGSTASRMSAIDFVDIEDLRITTKLKPQGGATIRILNCNVTSDQHFSVTGGTLIIENSNVKLVGATGNGALSTENNWVGSGTVVIRNSVFTLISSSTGANPVVVNLKINSEFAISGTCTVNGIFTNVDEADGSDTFITFRDAILDENSSIRGDENHDNVGASLRFEGYNILDGTTVEQYGNKSMTVEAGSTVDMSDGALITVGGEVEVSNCGNITLDNASISAGSFTNEGNLTLSNGSEVQLTGEFTNAKNGTLTAGLHSDGTLGITGSINNEGTVYIDLSHTDLPDGEDLYINLAGLSGSGEVVVIGGGGSYEPEETGGSAHPPRIRLSVPPTKTLYVSREWQDAGVYRKGTNVGSFTYFGYNAYADNPGSARGLVFSRETAKIVYYGGNGEDAFCDLDLSAAENAANQLTITTVGSMASTKMAIEFASALVVARDADNDRNISVVVKEGTKVVETKSLFIAKQNGNNGTTATFTDIDFYSANLSADGEYTVTVVDGNTTLYELESSEWSVTGLAADRDTASMGALTVGESQTVTLFGATMSLHDRTAAPATASITNNGTLKVGTGEDAVLEIPVAPSDAMRNVSVKIQIGANEEYHTVQAAKGATSITVESNSISPGQQYTVSVTDTKQISASHDAGTGHTVLKVGILKGNGNHESTRSINVTAQNAAGAKYTFTNVQVAGDATEVELDPLVALDNTSGTVTGTVAEQFSVSVDGNGNFILTAKGEHAEQRVSAYVQKTVGDTVYRFDYTFDVAAGSAAGEVGRVSTRLTTEGYYYVKSEEPAVTVTATVTDSCISGSVVKAESVTNDGKLIVASQEDFGSLSLTGIQSAEARTVQVTVKDGTYTVGTYDVKVGGNSTTASVISTDFFAGKNYTAKVTDTYYTAGSVSGSDTAPQLKFALGDVTAPSVLVQVADSASGDLVGTYTATRITEAGDDYGKYTIVSGEFAAETRYTISYYNTVKSQETLVARTECVSSASGVSAPRLAFAVEAGAERTITAVVKDGSGNIVGTFDVIVHDSAETCYLVSSEFTDTAADAYTVSIAGENTYDLTGSFTAAAEDSRKAAKLVLDVDVNTEASRWIEVTTKPTLALMTGLNPGQYGYTITTDSGTVAGTCIVDSEGKTIIKSDALTAGTEYTATFDDAGSTTKTAAAVDKYSIFVEKGAPTAELTSEDFMVGMDYSDVTIKDAYTATGEAAAGTLTLKGLTSSDKVIRPDGVLQRTVTVTVMDGAFKVGTYTIEDSAIIGGKAVISDSKFTADTDYTLLVEDTRTVVVTAETLTEFDAGAVTNNDTITVIDATFHAASLTNNGTISLTNALLTVGTTDGSGNFIGGTITNSAGKTITLDMNSLITAGSIANSGTITIDARLFDPSTTDMKKVIDLDTGAAAVSGLVLDVTGNSHASDIGILYDSVEYDYWVLAASQTTVYVNSAWATDAETGLAHKTGDSVGDKLYYGFNAFASFSEAYAETLKANPYSIKKAGASSADQQKIATIVVCDTPETAQPVEMTPENFRNKITLDDLQIAKSDTSATAIIPFTNAEGSVLTLIPADDAAKTITVQSGVTLQMNGTGSLHLGGDETTDPAATTTTAGKIVINGGIESEEGSVVVYGLTEVVGGTLKAASLTVNAADKLTVTGFSTLDIGGTGDGSYAIRLLDGTTLNNSSVAGGAINSDYNFTISGESALTGGVAVTATNNTITNTGSLTVDWRSRITSARFDNNTTEAATITVDAREFDSSADNVVNGLATVIDVNSKDGSLTLGNNKIALLKEEDSDVRLVQKLNGDICVGIIDQSTLYVNNDWTTYADGEEIVGNEGKFYGINAFANIADSRLTWSGDSTEQDVKPDCVTTNTIVFDGDTYTIGSKTYFYSDNKAEGVLIRGANEDGTATNVVLSGDRLYLTHAVTDYTDEGLAAEVGSEGNTPLYTIHKDLTLNVSRLNVGNAKDTSETNRTGGVANLAISGTLKGTLYVAPYSTVTVNKSGNVDVLDGKEAWLQLRPNAVLTVNGSDGEGARGFDDDEYQFRQDALNFIDGGTVNLNNTKAHLEYIRLDSVGSDQPLTVQNDVFNVTDSELVFGNVNLTAATPGVVFGSLDHSNTMTVTLTRSTVTAASKDFNPLAGVTVNVRNSTISAASVTNSGTITVDVTSRITADSVSGGVIDIISTGLGTTLTADFYILVKGTLDSTSLPTLIVDGDIDDPVTDGSAIGSTGYQVRTLGNTGVFLTKVKDPVEMFVDSSYTGSLGDETEDHHLIGFDAFTDNPDTTDDTTLSFTSDAATAITYAAGDYSALDLGGLSVAPTDLTISTSGDVTMGPLTVGNGSTVDQAVTFSGANVALEDAGTEPDTTASITVSDGSTLNIGGPDPAAAGNAAAVTAETVNNAGTIVVASDSSFETDDVTNTGSITVNNTMTSGTITNTDGTITVDGTLEAASISGGAVSVSNSLDVSGEISGVSLTVTAPGATDPDDVAVKAGTINGGSIKLTVTTSTLTETSYQFVDATLGTGTDAVSFTVNGTPITQEFQDVGNGYLFTTKGNTGAWLVQAQSRAALYVNSTYTADGYNEGHIYGYNAFSSFVDALTVASDLTINNASFADGITIEVENNITHDVIPAGEGSLNLVFQGVITVNGSGKTVTVYGDRYLRLGAATDTTSFVFNPDFVFNYEQIGDVNTGKYGLLLGTSPANSLGSVTMNGTFTSGNRFQAITDSLELNKAVTADTYVYLGSTDMVIAAPVESQTITFVGYAIVNSDATLTTPDDGNILIYDPAADVLIRGTGNSLYETIPQVKTGSLVLTDGALVTEDTRIKLKSNLTFCDDYDRFTEDGVDYTGQVTLTADNTFWDIGGDINVRFFTDPSHIDDDVSATLSFAQSIVEVGGNVINAAYSTTTGQDSAAYLGTAPAMTIELVDSSMFVDGDLMNDGEITLTKDSSSFNAISVAGNVLNREGATISVAASSFDVNGETSVLTNNGTFNVSGRSTLTINELGGSNPIELLNDAAIVDSAIASGGKLNVASGSVDFANSTMSSTALDNAGSIKFYNTVTVGAIDNKTAAASITVNGTLNSGAITNSGVTDSDGGITVNGKLSATGDIDNAGTITVYGTLTGGSINNGGTIELGTVGDRKAALTVTGAIDNTSGTININNVALLGEATSVIRAASINNASGTITIDATGFGGGTRKVIDVNSSTELDVNDITLNHAGTGVRLVQADDGDVFITDETQSTLFVNSTYSGQVTDDGHLMGWNAFSSFIEALTVAKGRSDDTTITVLSDITDSSDVQYLFGSGRFPGNVTIDGVLVVDEDNPSGRKPIVTLGGSLLEFDPTPADNKTFTFSAGSSDTVGVDFRMTNGSFWPNEHPETDDLAEYVISSDISAPDIVFKKGSTSVTATGTLTATGVPETSDLGNITFYKTGLDFSIDGEDGGFSVSDPQVNAGGSIIFRQGDVDFNNTFVSAKYLAVTDDNAGDSFAGSVNLTSDKTTWTISDDVFVRFYTPFTAAKFGEGGYAANFTFTNHSSLNVGGNLINIAYTTNDGTTSIDVFAGAPAMTIDLVNSTMTVGTYSEGNLVRGGAIENAGTIKMDKDSLITAGSITNSGAGTITIDATGFSGMKKVIDLESGTVAASLINAPSGVTLYYNKAEHDYWLTDAVNSIIYLNGTSAWNNKQYGDALGTYGTTNEYFGYNATNSSEAARNIAAAAGTTIEVTGGEFTAANSPAFNGVTTTIKDGTFKTNVCGGKNYSTGDGVVRLEVEEGEEKPTLSLTIDGGKFEKIVFGGDRVNTAKDVTRVADIEMTISGGKFYHSVAGAMALTNASGFAKLEGNVTLNIYGGEFNDNAAGQNVDWLYGGCIASTKSVGQSTSITGNVTVRINTSEKNDHIEIANLVVGSYGYGEVGGDTKLLLTGTEKNVTATGEIWGGCSSDKYEGYISDSHNRNLTTTVRHKVSEPGEEPVYEYGKRILSFTGFTGTLTSQENKILAFSDVVVEQNSQATVANFEGGKVSLSDVVTWTFENGSTLTGNFSNDFWGDTLNLKGFTSAVTDLELMFDANSTDSIDVFRYFDKLADVQMNGNSVSATFSQDVEAQTMTWAWNAGSTTGDTPESWLGGSLTVNKGTGIMSVTTIA